jgi:ribonuclease BN (tRNA processing enzyme)
MKIIPLITGSGYPKLFSSSILIQSSDDLCLYDMGGPYCSAELLAAIINNGYSPEDLHKVVFSHWHFDHFGDITPFPNIEPIISVETFQHLEFFINAARQALRSRDPILTMAQSIISHMAAQSSNQKADSIALSKSRAIANIMLKYIDIYTAIIESKKLKVLKLNDYESASIGEYCILVKHISHTGSDLVIYTYHDDKSVSIMAGDIVISSKMNSDNLWLKTFSRATVYPGHGMQFTINL